MALVVYALCGTGRGHTSRAVAVTDALRARVHRVRFAAGAPAADGLPGPVYRVPALRQAVRGNRVRLAATAGFTLLSEALHLGKPVLAVPNRGFFEQTVNARALVALGRGEAVVGRAVRAADVAGFLSRAAAYGRRAETPGAERTGREAAADAVEAALGIPPVALPAPTASRARRNPVHMRRLSWDVLRDNATP